MVVKDRDYNFQDFTGRDIDIVTCQLRGGTASVGGVVSRCSYGFPTVILLNPQAPAKDGDSWRSMNYQALSNLIWLTCPFLNDEIHRLESEGAIERIEGLLDNDREMRERMQSAHATTFFFRKRVYRHFMGEVSAVDDNESIFSSGVGGSRDTGGLKCLHVHYADYLLHSENIAGLITSHLLGKRTECEDERCRACLK